MGRFILDKNKTIFWDVDTQADFMEPEGRLYVRDAEQIIDKVSLIRRYALENGYSVVASADWHKGGDEEISANPDYENTFPEHCPANKPGSERVGFLGSVGIEPIEVEPMDREAIRKLLEKPQFHIVIHKSKFDVFSNPNTAKILEYLRPERIAVFGVSLDVCVYHAVQGLLDRCEGQVILLADAVKGLGIKPRGEILEEFKAGGAVISRFSELRRQLES